MTTIETKTLWNEIYCKGSPASSGRPGLMLTQFAGPLAPGRALELGCARGDDAIWLARQGWHVTAIDVSSVALGYAAANVADADLSDRIGFEEHDLAMSFPEGAFDLVTASFLHSPQDWPRARVLARAAEAVLPDGHLLIIEHASRLPWSRAPEDMVYPAAEETLAAMALPTAPWQRLCVCTIARQAHGPEGQTAIVKDNVIFLRRIG